ncbi:MAG TPA: YkgJ family cysteine cluster protein [Opitutaceae bacterium]|nr:YkgJ family cysteine cluster protein [Opitutaceae bacterium]
MPSPFAPDLFDHAAAQMGSRLRRVRTPHQMMAALGWGMEQLDRTYAATPTEVLANVACGAGCASCCHVPVDVQAHEVFLAAHHIQRHFSPDQLDAAIRRLSFHRDRVASFTVGERDASRQPCALLLAGDCSIYAARPQPCRAHHTSDADACDANMTEPTHDITRVYIPALRARMFAVMLGIDEALESAGYDERSYDFGSALHEALTNGFCLGSWMNRQAAFPDACLADRAEPALTRPAPGPTL